MCISLIQDCVKYVSECHCCSKVSGDSTITKCELYSSSNKMHFYLKTAMITQVKSEYIVRD